MDNNEGTTLVTEVVPAPKLCFLTCPVSALYDEMDKGLMCYSRFAYNLKKTEFHGGSLKKQPQRLACKKIAS